MPKGQVDLMHLHEGLVIEALLKHAGQQNLQIFRVHSFVHFNFYLNICGCFICIFV